MRSISRIVFLTFAIVLMLIDDGLARGGRGGGGRGGGGRGGGGASRGGYSRPSGAVSRSPAVSRPTSSYSRPRAPSTRPATGGGQPRAGQRPTTGVRPGSGTQARPGQTPAGRPTAGQLQNFLDLGPPSSPSTRPGNAASQRPSNLPGSVAGGVAGGAAAEFLRSSGPRAETLPGAGQRPGAGDRAGANRPGAGQRPTVGGHARVQNLPSRINNRQEWHDNRMQRRDEIRDQVQENHPRLDFWSDHPGWAAWRINRPYRWATWAAITGWVGYGWSDATPYSYGENVYYDDGSVYYNDDVVATEEEYAQQAEDIVAAAPQVAPASAEWMPLGVFALTPDGQASGPDPSLFLQLAISKEGVITGTLNNSVTNRTQTIEGYVDKATQRCAWNVVGQTRPIMETGISNLTEDTAPALVHFADGETQQWLMVRLDDPQTTP